MIHLGVDTLTYHLRIESGAITLEEIFAEAADVGCTFVQITLHHIRKRELSELRDLRSRADALGLRLLASGDVIGRGRDGDEPHRAADRIVPWLERAEALGSPILRVVSGFYRADLAAQPALIELERRFVIDALKGVGVAAETRGVRLLLENHSDFRVSEYQSIIDEVGASQLGVFLDIINPISGFEDPLPVVAELAPYAGAAHAKDYRLRSIPTDDGYHRRGFEVHWCYPGEGVADLSALLSALKAGVGAREVFLSVEGLDNYADRADQRDRLRASLGLLSELVK